MRQLPTKYIKRIRKFLPIETEGLTLYPITVEQWEDFYPCVPALEFMRNGLPVPLLTIPLLDAFWQIEIANSAPQEGGGARWTPFSDAVYVLWMALRLGPDTERKKALERIFPVPDKNNPATIERVIFQRAEDDFLISVTPRQFERLRPILAAQNGVKLHDETENPELVYADRVLRAAKGPKLDEDLAKRVAWCAALCHAEEAEIYEWPILKFNNRCETLQRTLDYVIFGVGASTGLVKYNDGPPVPSPYYARHETAADRLLTSGTAAADAAVRSGMENARSDLKIL